MEDGLRGEGEVPWGEDDRPGTALRVEPPHEQRQEDGAQAGLREGIGIPATSSQGKGLRVWGPMGWVSGIVRGHALGALQAEIAGDQAAGNRHAEAEEFDEEKGGRDGLDEPWHREDRVP